MNSIAQQAVPNGNGQNELLDAQSSSASNFVVTQLSPIILFMGRNSSRGGSLSLVTTGHKLGQVEFFLGVTRATRFSPTSLNAAGAGGIPGPLHLSPLCRITRQTYRTTMPPSTTLAAGSRYCSTTLKRPPRK